MIYKHCPVCGETLQDENHDGQKVPVCQNSSCGFIFWQNSKPCACAIISDDQDRILMTVRGKNPDKGKLDLPGGFLQAGEHPNDGVLREIAEELNVKIENTGYLGFVMDKYGTDGEYTLNIGILAKIVSGTPQAGDDAAAIEWIDPTTIDTDRLAFMNNKEFLEMWMSRHSL